MSVKEEVKATYASDESSARPRYSPIHMLLGVAKLTSFSLTGVANVLPPSVLLVITTSQSASLGSALRSYHAMSIVPSGLISIHGRIWSQGVMSEFTLTADPQVTPLSVDLIRKMSAS